MKIFVKAKPNAKEQKVEKISETHFAVAVKEPPINGLANEAIAKALAEYFGAARPQVRLISGFSSSQKVFEITKMGSAAISWPPHSPQCLL